MGTKGYCEAKPRRRVAVEQMHEGRAHPGLSADSPTSPKSGGGEPLHAATIAAGPVHGAGEQRVSSSNSAVFPTVNANAVHMPVLRPDAPASSMPDIGQWQIVSRPRRRPRSSPTRWEQC